jgi:hypothetical protein
MSNSEDDTAAGGELFVGGSVAALRDLAEPAPLSAAQKDIIRWYNGLVQQLAGPTSGDSRGPALEPPWMRHGPQIENASVSTEEAVVPRAILVEGSGFAGTSEVWLDGRQTPAWRVLADSRLLIKIPDESEDVVSVVIRTQDGDTGALVDLTTDDDDAITDDESTID